LEFVVGGKFTRADDVVDVGEIPCLGAIAEQLWAVPVRDLIGKLGDRVRELALCSSAPPKP
jgi:hypothetical protein